MLMSSFPLPLAYRAISLVFLALAAWLGGSSTLDASFHAASRAGDHSFARSGPAADCLPSNCGDAWPRAVLAEESPEDGDRDDADSAESCSIDVEATDLVAAASLATTDPQGWGPSGPFGRAPPVKD